MSKGATALLIAAAWRSSGQADVVRDGRSEEEQRREPEHEKCPVQVAGHILALVLANPVDHGGENENSTRQPDHEQHRCNNHELLLAGIYAE